MILVTGSTGNVGGELTAILANNKVEAITASRSPEPNGRLPVRRFSFTEPETWAPALKDIDSLFLVRPPQISKVKRDMLPFLSFAHEKEVQQIVFLSVVGAGDLPFIPHAKIEKAIRQLGFTHTFLRAGFFMQNLSTTHREEIRSQREIVAPAGKGKTSFVHVRDLAEVAAIALTSDRLDNAMLDLVGDDTLSYYDVARKLSDVIGETVVYREPSILRFLAHRRRLETPLRFALVMAALYLPTRFGRAEISSSMLGDILGREPISFDEFAAEERSCWIR